MSEYIKVHKFLDLRLRIARKLLPETYVIIQRNKLRHKLTMCGLRGLEAKSWIENYEI